MGSKRIRIDTLHHRDYFGNASGNPEICIIACGLTEVEALK